MHRAFLIGFLALTTLPAFAHADNDVKFNAQVRHRFEFVDKDFNSDQNPYTFSFLRTRIGAKFNPAEGVGAFIQLQDSRTFGEETSTLGDGSADLLDLHQGFLFIKDFYGKPINLKLGRYEVNYGPQRLIGAVGWHNVGRSFDGGTARLHKENYWVDAFAFTEAESLMAGDIGDAYVAGVWANWMANESYSVQPFWVWQRKSPSSRLNRHTIGFYVKGKGNFYHEAEFAYQTGTITSMVNTLVEQDVSASMAALNVGMKFPDMSGAPNLSAGVDYLSGDAGTDSTEFKVFDTLYATNHKYYGFMDFFLNIPANTFGKGLIDSHVKLGVKPHTNLVTNLAVHVFRAAEDFAYTDANAIQATSKSFGTEVDLTAKLKYNEKLGFTFGASIFSPGDIFKQMKGDDTSSWFYVMTTLNG